jgi:probable phosphomutase (TIGR03848 family)
MSGSMPSSAPSSVPGPVSRDQAPDAEPAAAGAQGDEAGRRHDAGSAPGSGMDAASSDVPADARSPATLLLLVRHGATATTGKVLPGRAPGLDLSDTGRDQAAAAARRIAALQDGEHKVAAVYASPLERTRQTALPIAAAVGREVSLDAGLVELDIGEWTGLEMKVAQQTPEWTTVQRYPSGFRFPGGESFVEMQSRIVDAAGRLSATHAGEIVVAVSHADPIRALVAHALGTHLDLFQRIVVSPGSLTAVAYAQGGPTVLTVNATEDMRALVST